MRVQMSEGHLRPSVANGLFTKPGFQSIEGDGELLGSFPLPMIRRPFLKK